MYTHKYNSNKKKLLYLVKNKKMAIDFPDTTDALKNVSEKTNFRLHIIKILQMLLVNVQLTEIKITIHG